MKREPWFVHGEEGTIRPITSAGRLSFLLALAWLLLSAVVGFGLFLRSPGPAAVITPFVVAIPGLAVFAYFAITRTSK